MGSTDVAQRLSLTQGLAATKSSGEIRNQNKWYTRLIILCKHRKSLISNLSFFFISTQLTFNKWADSKKSDKRLLDKKEDVSQLGMSSIVLSRKSTFERQRDTSPEKVCRCQMLDNNYSYIFQNPLIVRNYWLLLL